MRRTIISSILSLLVCVGWGQAYNYRYWIDDDIGNAVSGSATGEKQLDVSIASLDNGFHSLHVQAYAGGKWSSVRTRYFLKDEKIEATTARYWIDNDMTTLHNDAATSGIIEIDISSMGNGLHAVHYQMISSDGLPSTVRTRYFLKDEKIEATTARYWIDNDMTTLHNDAATSGIIEIDISSMGNGLHAVHYQMMGSDGLPSTVRTRYFLKDEKIEATTARYWIDNDMTTLHNGVATSGVIDIDISKLGVGFHAVHYQTISVDGTPSAVRTRYFLVEHVQKGTLSADISIDNGETTNYALSDEEIVIDITDLGEGEHTLHVTLLDANGSIVGVQENNFSTSTSVAPVLSIVGTQNTVPCEVGRNLGIVFDIYNGGSDFNGPISFYYRYGDEGDAICQTTSTVIIPSGDIFKFGSEFIPKESGICHFWLALNKNPDEIIGNSVTLEITDATSDFAKTVHVTEAGTLSNYISDAQKYTLKELTITGPLNSTDFKLLRDMAGNNYLGNETEGQLQKLDLSGASVVTGGEYYLEAEYVYYQPNYGISTLGDHLAIENDNEIGKDVFKGCKLKEVILPDNLASTANQAFAYCKYLTDIVMPEGLTCIGESLFMGCDLLQPPSIPASVETIGRYAFAYCDGFTSFDIPNGINTLESNLFYKCQNLTSVTIPASVTKIKSQVFELCNSLEKVEIYAKEPPSTNYHSFTTQANATLYVPYGCKSAYAAISPWNEFKQIIEMEQNASPIITFADAKVKAICIENWDTNGDGKLTEAEAAAVTSIGTVFSYNNEIESFNELKYFTSLEEIGYMAFYECTMLKSITFPQSVTTINSMAFYGCNSLTNLKLPEGLVYLYDDAFYSCNGLTTVTIPANVYAAKNMIFASSSFPSCKNLKEIIVDPGNPYLESVDDVLYLKDRTGIMQYPAGKTDATYNILEGVEGIFGGCFAGCEYLTSVKLPEGLRYVNGPVFSDCVNLKEIELPSSLVTFDGYNLIYGCTNLEKIVSHITAPKNIDFKVFQVEDGEFTSTTLYVPKGTKILYQAADGWKNFKNIVEVSINTLHGVDLQVSPGSKAVLAVNMTNEDEVKLCQFDLHLPTGVTVALKSNGKLDAKLTDRAENHSISSQQLSNGNYRFIISSLDNGSFTGNSGALVEITLDIPATMEAGEYTVKLLNAELSVPDGNDLKVVNPTDTESKLTIKAYTSGDVNNDGSVSVTDVGCVINYILEQFPSVFIFDAADMNGDKSISVTDVGMIINLILNEGSVASPQWNRVATEGAHLTKQLTAEGYQLQLGNKDAFIGFQMDLQVANSATINGMKLIGGDDHLMTYRQLVGGIWRIICYSPTNSTFTGNDSTLLNIAANSDVTICNVRLTTAGLNEVSLDTVSAGTTSITDVKGLQSEELKVYSLDGRLCRTIRVQTGENPLNGLKAGVYMIGNRKVVVK